MNIYVSTYKKYNEGNLKGEWIDPSEFINEEEFIEACKALHKDEADPELMFQDVDEIHHSLVSESFISPDLWKYIDLATDDNQKEIIDAGLDMEIPLDNIEDSYVGTYNTDAELAQEVTDESDLPGWAMMYVDWDYYGRDLLINDYMEGNGHYFYRQYS